MEIVYLSHCVPYPPDKGEKIRAYHEVRDLAREHRVHVACFAKNERELAQARDMEAWCASVHVELASGIPSLAQAAVAYGLGSSLNQGFYRSPAMGRHVRALAARVTLDCAVVYSAVMTRFVPPELPFVLDMIDVDSEKWFSFSKSRRPAWFFRTEARRYRDLEIKVARRATVTFLATENERDIFRCIAGAGIAVEALENGVDSEYYDPATAPVDPALAGRRFLVFTGAFHSYANIDGAVWFVREVFPALREQVDPDLELFLVGMNPAAPVRDLGKRPGVTVTGYVADTRPYLAGATAVVAPLRVARGIQNKVLEGLAMDKPVLVSTEVGKTFGDDIPAGVTVCGADAGEWVGALRTARQGLQAGTIRQGMVKRWAWGPKMEKLRNAVNQTRAL